MAAGISQKDLDDAIDTIIGEAVGGGKDGMDAVAWVIANRARDRNQSIGDVVRAKRQFTGYSNPGPSAKASRSDPAARKIAEQAILRAVERKGADPTGGADHFDRSGDSPPWSKGMAQTAEIGGNTFYSSKPAATRTATAAPTPTRARSRPPTATEPRSAAAAAEAVAASGDTRQMLSSFGLPELDRTVKALDGLPAEQRTALMPAVVALARAGLDPVVVEGARSIEEQDALYYSGRGVTKAKGGNSYHNYSAAIDVVPAAVLNTKNWSPESPLWKKQGEIIAGIPGLKWGGDFNDPAHIQIAAPLSDFRNNTWRLTADVATAAAEAAGMDQPPANSALSFSPDSTRPLPPLPRERPDPQGDLIELLERRATAKVDPVEEGATKADLLDFLKVRAEGPSRATTDSAVASFAAPPTPETRPFPLTRGGEMNAPGLVAPEATGDVPSRSVATTGVDASRFANLPVKYWPQRGEAQEQRPLAPPGTASVDPLDGAERLQDYNSVIAANQPSQVPRPERMAGRPVDPTITMEFERRGSQPAQQVASVPQGVAAPVPQQTIVATEPRPERLAGRPFMPGPTQPAPSPMPASGAVAARTAPAPDRAPVRTAMLPSGKPVEIGRSYQINDQTYIGGVDASGRGTLNKADAGILKEAGSGTIVGDMVDSEIGKAAASGLRQVRPAVSSAFGTIKSGASDVFGNVGDKLGEWFGGSKAEAPATRTIRVRNPAYKSVIAPVPVEQTVMLDRFGIPTGEVGSRGSTPPVPRARPNVPEFIEITVPGGSAPVPATMSAAARAGRSTSAAPRPASRSLRPVVAPRPATMSADLAARRDTAGSGMGGLVNVIGALLGTNARSPTRAPIPYQRGSGQSAQRAIYGSGGGSYGSSPGQMTAGLAPGDRVYNPDTNSWGLKR